MQSASKLVSQLELIIIFQRLVLGVHFSTSGLYSFTGFPGKRMVTSVFHVLSLPLLGTALSYPFDCIYEGIRVVP